MSRVAKNPVDLPQGVTATVDGETGHRQGRQGLADAGCAAGVQRGAEGQALRIEVVEPDATAR